MVVPPDRIWSKEIGASAPSRSIARACAISAVPFVAAASETVAMVNTVAFGTNTRQPWSLVVTIEIA